MEHKTPRTLFQAVLGFPGWCIPDGPQSMEFLEFCLHRFSISHLVQFAFSVLLMNLTCECLLSKYVYINRYKY